MVFHQVSHELAGLLSFVDSDHHHPGLFDARCVQQIRSSGVTIKHFEPKDAEPLQVFRLVIEHDRLEPGCHEDAIDNAAESPVTRNHDIAGLRDLVRFTLLGGDETMCNHLFVNDEQQRRQQHRQRNDEQ